jgi:hypothetical protein
MNACIVTTFHESAVAPLAAINANMLPSGVLVQVRLMRYQSKNPVYIKGTKTHRIPLQVGTPAYGEAEQALLRNGWMVVVGA